MGRDTGVVDLTDDPGDSPRGIATDRPGDATEAQRVIDLSVASYHAAGHTTHTGDLPPPVSVYVPSLRRAEIVLDHGEHPLDPQTVETLEALTGSGIEVHVLAPLGTIGTLRGTLRSRATRVQGWWRDESGSIKFDAPRVP